jgi:hypothetical protein
MFCTPSLSCSDKMCARGQSNTDLPPLNEAASVARILSGRNQGRAIDATREDGTGGANHPDAPRSRRGCGEGEDRRRGGEDDRHDGAVLVPLDGEVLRLRIHRAKRLKEFEEENSQKKQLLADADL